jgi:hypothetical protein
VVRYLQALTRMHKYSRLLIILILLTSCDKKLIKQTETKSTKEDSIQRAYHIGTMNKVSGKILGKEYHAFCTDDTYSSCVTNSKNDTLIKDKNLNPIPEFIDFDKDGIVDIAFKSNLENQYDLIKFDTITNKFKKVKDFDKFLEPKKINNSNYWFGYHAAGCADECWESDLFYLDNFEAKRIGNISKYYIDESGNFEFVISRVSNDKLIPIKHLDKKSVEKWEENKFEAIESYWIKNYKNFTKPAGNSG